MLVLFFYGYIKRDCKLFFFFSFRERFVAEVVGGLFDLYRCFERVFFRLFGGGDCLLF